MVENIIMKRISSGRFRQSQESVNNDLPIQTIKVEAVEPVKEKAVDDDYLREMFRRLNLEDFMNAAEGGVQSNAIAKETFVRNYKDLRLNFGRPSDP